MATELLLAIGTRGWDDVSTAVTDSVTRLLAGESNSVVVAMPNSGQRIEAHALADGQLRLAAAGNDSLVGGDRLTVRDERAVIAVGFSVTSNSWGTFYWDWTAPVEPSRVASGIVRTMRDIYKANPEDLEVTAIQ